MSKRIFEVGEIVKAVKIDKLTGNQYAPKLELHKDYEIIGICLDTLNNQHLDVGLECELNFVTSYETGEQLPDSDKIHWCHPSRFE